MNVTTLVNVAPHLNVKNVTNVTTLVNVTNVAVSHRV